MNARIYGRFSSIPQERGDSRRRQIEGARAVALKLGYNVTAEYFDESTSGKAGLNLEREFGKMLKEAKAGEIILVEFLDRIGRQNPFLIGNLIYQTIQKGISINAWAEGKIITPENIDTMETQFSIFTGAAVGHQENVRKIKRLNETFEETLKNARKGIPTDNLTKCLPQAFQWDKKLNKFIVNTEIELTIKRIFNEYNSGKGTTAICQGLNNDNIPTLYKQGKNTIGRVKCWTETTLKKILCNTSYNGVLTVKGETLKGLIPKIVSDETFNKAQMLLARFSTRRGNLQNTRVNNLFVGISKCKML